MSIAHRPRRLGASILALTLVAGILLVAPAGAAESRQASPTGSSDRPWWVDWLEVFDLNDNRIDDEAERRARAFVIKGKPMASVPVLVTFKRQVTDREALVDILKARNAYFFKTQPVADLDVPAKNLSRLATVPGIAAVEYDMELRPFLEVSGPATQANRGGESNDFYNGLTAEDLGYTGEGMVVAVLDTGVQDQQSAFEGKWIAGTDVTAQAPVGTCFNPPDDNEHGTHVASTAVGSDSETNLFGTAKDARLVEVKIAAGGATGQVGPASVGSSNRGFEFVKLYNDGLVTATPLCGVTDEHIDVATLSFGSLGRGGPNAGTSEAFIDALAQSGVAVTVAVGNCGPSPSATCTFGDSDNGISSPGNAAGAIGVANSNDANTVPRSDDAISSSSSRGPNNGNGDSAAEGATSAADLKDRYRKPDVAAPGTSIEAAGLVPGATATKSGTSMATPHVAGIAALLLQAGEEVKAETGGVNLMASTGNGFSASNEYVFGQYPVRDALIYSADYKDVGIPAEARKWTGPNRNGVMWNNTWGYGHVTTFRALCWAWSNVLAPGGATPPTSVGDACGLADPEEVEEPNEPISIVDPFGDANYVNGQGVVVTGDQTDPGNVLESADIGQVWFSNTADSISAHVQTNAAPNGEAALIFRVQVDPGSGTQCLWFQGTTPGPGVAAAGATLRDTCPSAVATSTGSISFSEGEEGTSIMNLTFPLSAHPALKPGTKLNRPIAHVRNSLAGAVTAPEVDNTAVGFPYKITGTQGDPEPTPTPTVTSSPTPTPTSDPGPQEVIFEETGYIAASNPASANLVGGVAGNENQFWCDGEAPFTQGVDGYVFSLPERAAAGDAHATLTGDGFAYDLDMHFYDATCEYLDSAATSEVDEVGDLPAGTRYVVANNWLGADTNATLRVVAGGQVDPDPTPTPDPILPVPGGCTDAPDHVWFLGIAYDSEGREDFKADARNFEFFLSTLRDTYCIPSSQSTILNMEKDDEGNDYKDPETGRTYSEGSEANLKRELRRMGAEASAFEDSQFFFFLSSHGNTTTGAITGGSCEPTRIAGSFSALKDGGGQDGTLNDCELGAELNANFLPETKMFVAVDCSFCGGFSDSITQVSGTIPDGSVPTSSGVPAPNRIVVTGCAITTECFGSSPAENGGVTYHHMRNVLEGEIPCDGWTAPGFPTLQGFDVPVNEAAFNAPDGRCTASEWFFGAVWSAYTSFDVIGIQQQFRIKYGFDSLADDILISDGTVDTQLAFSSSAYDGTYSHETTIEATLTDDDGNPLSDKDIAFELTGDDEFSDNFVVTTNGDGVASANLAADLVPGTYQLFAHYAGENGVFETSSAAPAVVEIAKEGTSIATAASGKGPNRTLEATLIDHDGAPPIEGRTVVFYGIEGEVLGSDVTDGNGFASIPAPPGYRGQDAIWEARFDGSGDRLYAGSSKRHPT